MWGDFIWPIQSKHIFTHLFTNTTDLKPNVRISYPCACCGAFSFISQLMKSLSEWIVKRGESEIVRSVWIRSFYYLVLKNKINNTTRKGMQKWGKEPMFFCPPYFLGHFGFWKDVFVRLKLNVLKWVFCLLSRTTICCLLAQYLARISTATKSIGLIGSTPGGTLVGRTTEWDHQPQHRLTSKSYVSPQKAWF